MLGKYPDEMTISVVLQQTSTGTWAPGETFFFGDAAVRRPAPSLWLSTSVPYAAVTRFYDPSVQFLLQFEPPAATDAKPAEPEAKTAATDPETPPADGEAKVVSLDQFRKK